MLFRTRSRHLLGVAPLLAFVLFMTSCQSQKSKLESCDQWRKACQQIKDIKEGVLIVRVETKDKAIALTKKALIAPHASESAKKNLQARLDQLEGDRDLIKTKLAAAFEKYFDFCKVVFMPDIATNQLMDNQRKGIFWDKQMHPDPSISVENTKYYILDYTYSANGSSRSLQMSDDSLKLLSPPFPFTSSGVMAVEMMDGLTMHVRYYNQVLHSFYKNAPKKLEKLQSRVNTNANQPKK